MQRRLSYRLITVVLLGAAMSSLPGHAQSTAAPGKPSAGPPATPAASPLPTDLDIKRIILKDGSYQPIEKFEFHGDRVRYLSAERYVWEEVPYSLVDWPATEKYARENGQHQVSAETKEVDAEERAERERQNQLTPLVAPGVRLPATGGVFLLDVYHGQAQLNELTQNGSEVKRNMGGNVLRATVNPLAGQKQTIELKGQHARVQSHVSDPFIYIDVDLDDNTTPTKGESKDVKERFRIVRVQSLSKKDIRVVGNLKVALYGKVSQQQTFVPSKTEVFSGPWLKITPAEPLERGEYALVEMLGNQMNLYVWDFGVNP